MLTACPCFYTGILHYTYPAEMKWYFHAFIYTHMHTNRDEIIAYAQYLGMDPEQDEDLLWIAHLALTAPLPAGWTEHEV
jgi:hypothetical protein